MADTDRSRSDTRTRVVEVAARLLHEQGPGGVTTRGVARAAGVQAPTIYRLFGDKDGLLDAVAEHAMVTQAVAKQATAAAASAAEVDPLEELRSGWDDQIAFGLANPTVFRLLSDPDRVRDSPGARIGRGVLASRVHRLATAARLRVSEDRAADLLQAAGIGVIQTLLGQLPDQRDTGLADAMFEAVLGQVLTDATRPTDAGPVAAAVALRAHAPELTGLSDAERDLLVDWLDRAVAATS